MRRVILTGLATVLTVGCGITKNTGQAPVTLLITRVQGVAAGGSAADNLLSDVLTHSTSGTTTTNTVINDDALLTFAAVFQSPDVDSATAASGKNDVQLVRYQVHFVRSDNHEQQGVDVPYDVMGSLSGLVPAALGSTSGSVTADIIVVRHAAKLEPPLSALAGLGGEQVITTVAQITVWGKTVGGDAVTATASLQVAFGDFPDS